MIIAGGFDLSMGAIFAMAGVVAALVARDLGQFAAVAAVAPFILFAVALDALRHSNA